jgi:gliding motility-associated-like protein
MYKNFSFILTFFACISVARAQLVLTYAGQLNLVGAADGAASLARFNNPHGICVAPDGVAYVADRYNHVIRKIDALGNVTTLAGKAGFKGDVDDQGENARFNEPWGVCCGTDGYIYVADTRNNKIRRVSTDGVVSTYAGTGAYGIYDGPRLQTTWGNPTGLKMAADGTLFVAEHLTFTIRKIAPDGQVSVLAGQPYLPGAADGIGGAARFWRPYGLAIDQNGQILVADEWNHRIRRVNPQTGAVTTIAGTGQIGNTNGLAMESTFNYPWDMTTDSVGNIYVADGYNYVIRKITPNGQITNWCGSPSMSGGVDGFGQAARFSGATGITYCQSQNVFYVSDAYNHLIRRIVPNLGGTASIGLLNPTQAGKNYCVGDFVKIKVDPSGYPEYRFYHNDSLIQQLPTFYLDYKITESGAHRFRAEAINGTEILKADEIVIKADDLPQPFLTTIGENPFFAGDSLTIISSAGVSYLWSSGQTTAIIEAKTAGFYFVEISDNNGCIGRSDSIEVQIIPVSTAPMVLLDGSARICPGQSRTLTSSYAQGNQWLRDNFPIPGATNRTLLVTEAGDYQVRVKDALDVFLFSNVAKITISDFSILKIKASKTPASVGENIEFYPTLSETANLFSWTFGDGSSSTDEQATHFYANSGQFPVQLIAESANEGCLDTLFINNFIKILDGETPDSTVVGAPEFWLPTAFTPNGDGQNDTFFPHGADITTCNLQIFNHWGELIFETKSTDGWDGFFQNRRPAMAATYTWVADFGIGNQPKKILNGKVTLIR